MRFSFLCSVSLALTVSTAAFAEGDFPATLAGHAILPAQTFIDAPADAPADLKTSGKYTTGSRVDALGSVMGKSSDRPTGVSLPFKGQPLQGHSGIKKMADGTFWVITDNGFGLARYNSADSMLYLNRLQDRLGERHLRAARDHFPARSRQESAVPHRPRGYRRSAISPAPTSTSRASSSIGDKFWIGDEFGPYVLKADKTGKVLAVFETVADGKPVRSPDIYRCSRRARPARATRLSTSAAPRAMRVLPRPRTASSSIRCWRARCGTRTKKDIEKVDGKDAARILEFDVAAEKFTGRFWHYVFEAQRPCHRRLQHDRRDDGPRHRARQRRRHARQGLPARPARRELLRRPRQIQARLQDRTVPMRTPASRFARSAISTC